jgi:hypothetical protein
VKRRHRTGLQAVALAAISPLLAATFAAGTAYAAPGNGHSADAPGQQKQQAGTTPSPAPGNSDHSQGTAGTSGSVSQPQPYSTADRNNTGANDTGSTNPYRSTRNGSPSLNGNGNGQATGKPCAGCVGKADNKNPPGQQPNGSDHNAGYECDRNNGIGKSNPAHTGCTATPPPCTGTNCGGHGGCTINCGQGGCQTNCGNNNCVPTTVNTCVPVSECTAISCVPGRGGGHVLGASTVLAAVTGNALPNTSGAGGGLNWPAILAVVSLIGAAVYWRQLVVPLLPKE